MPERRDHWHEHTSGAGSFQHEFLVGISQIEADLRKQRGNREQEYITWQG